MGFNERLRKCSAAPACLPRAELVEERELGGLAAYHYSFMGATDPRAIEASAGALAGIMRREGMNCRLPDPV